MSRGPGWVERRLQALFTGTRKPAFTTTELCQQVYGVKHVHKKHRVSVLRAVKRVAERSMPTLWRRVRRHDREDEWHDHRSFPGHARDSGPAAGRRPRKS